MDSVELTLVQICRSLVPKRPREASPPHFKAVPETPKSSDFRPSLTLRRYAILWSTSSCSSVAMREAPGVVPLAQQLFSQTPFFHRFSSFSPVSPDHCPDPTLPSSSLTPFWSMLTQDVVMWASAVTQGGAVAEMFVIACHGCLWPHSTFPHAFSPIVHAQQVYGMLLARCRAVAQPARGDGHSPPKVTVFCRQRWVAFLHVYLLLPLQTLSVSLNVV